LIGGDVMSYTLSFLGWMTALGGWGTVIFATLAVLLGLITQNTKVFWRVMTVAIICLGINLLGIILSVATRLGGV